MSDIANQRYEALALDLDRQADQLLDSLVAIRIKHGLTQAELADRMNVPVSVVKEIENGQKSLVSLLSNYALEAGAKIRYQVSDDQA